MNLGTAITLLVVGGMLFLALRSIVRDMRTKTSKCSGCTGACSEAGCSACDAAEHIVAKLGKGDVSECP